MARPELDALKSRFCGGPEVVFHSRDIRKHQGPFAFLADQGNREQFYEACNDLIRGLGFAILAVIILKTAHIPTYGDCARHPYHLSFEFMLERYSQLIRRHRLWNRGYVLAESRGEHEDCLPKEEYERLRRSGTPYQDLNSLTGMCMRKKAENIAGLQIADLAAYPIAAKVLRPDIEHKAFDVLRPKVNAAPRHKGSYLLGYGLKVFPQPTLEHYLLWGPKSASRKRPALCDQVPRIHHSIQAYNGLRHLSNPHAQLLERARWWLGGCATSGVCVNLAQTRPCAILELILFRPCSSADRASAS